MPAAASNEPGAAADGQECHLPTEGLPAEQEFAGLELPPLQPRLSALLHNSPFIDTEYPVTAYEAIKLIVMAPVVAWKARGGHGKAAPCTPLPPACVGVRIPPPTTRLQLALIAAVIGYAWAVMKVLLVGHTSQSPMHPFRYAPKRWATLAPP